MIKKINIATAFAGITEYWEPKIGGDINDSQLKMAKFGGAFEWHHHAHEDELFLIVKGRLCMHFRDSDGGDVVVDEGEYLIVPKGVEHCPEAITAEVHCIMLEPKTTRNTGNLVNDRTRIALDRV